MIFYGASGHCKVIIEAWIASGGAVTAIVDDDPNVKQLGQHLVSGKYNPEWLADVPMIISIGDNQIRKRIAEDVKHSFGKCIHPSAVISESAVIGSGSVVMPGAVVNAEAQLGEHVIVNTSSVVEHDCRVGDYVHVSPNATLCGGVTVGEGTHIGAGATIIPNIKVGKWAVIGAGSVVIDDVPDFALVVGVPGKVKAIRTMP